MKDYLINRAISLNGLIKNNLQQCEDELLNLLLEDSSMLFIESSIKQRDEQDSVPILAFTLDKTTYTVLENGKTAVRITYSPVDTTARKLRYESSDESIFTVTSTGVIVGNSNGSATLTVTSVINETLTATALVMVVKDNIPSQTYSLGALSNVDANIDDAPDGSIIVKVGDKYVSDTYTETISIDITQDPKTIWRSIANTYPAIYAIGNGEALHPAEIVKTDSRITIKYSIGLYNYVIELIRDGDMVYKNEYYSEYLE